MSKLLLRFAITVALLFGVVLLNFIQSKSNWQIYTLHGVLFAVMLVVAILAKANKLNLAKYIIITIPPYLIILLSLANLHYDFLSNTYGYLIPRFASVVYLLAPLIFFGLEQKRKMIISTLIILPTILFFDPIHNLMGVKLSDLPYVNEYYITFFIMFSVFYAISLFSILAIQKKNLLYRNKVSTLNEDLTAEKQSIANANKKLNEIILENTDYETFIEANPDTVFIVNQEGKQIYYNHQIKNISGYSKNELLGKGFRKILPPSEIKKCEKKLLEVFLNKEIEPFETILKKKNGTLIPVEITGRLLQYNEETVGLGTIKDITERKKKSEFLEFQSNLYKILDITSKNIALSEAFEETLSTLFDIPSLKVEKKGIIFLKNQDGNLEPSAQINCNILLNTCALVKPGQCLCGKALQTKKSIFCNSVGHDHTIQPEGMKPHGHYVIPIKEENETLGILCLYVKQGEPKNDSTAKYLETIAQILSRKISAENQKENLNKKNIEIQEQHQLLDIVLTELHDSINYTRFLQNALLPNSEIIKNYMAETEILFLPKDRVSGDFYFIEAIDNKYLYFGIGDCTGHGIPGAFLSSMAIEAVKMVIQTNTGKKPNFILEELREISYDRFSSNIDNNQADSMDMALCMIDKKENQFYYAGGFINIYIAKNSGELVEISATKSPIGSYPVKLDFELNKIDLEKGDIIYMTSDGYLDQFGFAPGSAKEKPKKFMRKRFKDQILKIKHLPCDQQIIQFNKTISDWKGNFEQTDDITLFIAKY